MQYAPCQNVFQSDGKRHNGRHIKRGWTRAQMQVSYLDTSSTNVSVYWLDPPPSTPYTSNKV